MAVTLGSDEIIQVPATVSWAGTGLVCDVIVLELRRAAETLCAGREHSQSETRLSVLFGMEWIEGTTCSGDRLSL